MEIEVGGNFCEELTKGNQRIEDSERVLWFDTGRSAIRCLLDLLGDRIERVMLPQYVCESMLKPFIEKRYQIIYYPINTNFQLIREDFEQLLKAESPQLVLVQAYFGVDTLCEDRAFLKELSSQGIIVVEDITHSLLADYWRSGADYMVGSLRKWCSIPDGGVLIKESNNGKEHQRVGLHLEENSKFLDTRLAAQNEKRKFLGTEDQLSDKGKFISLFDKSESILDEQKKYYTMSVYTRERIISVDWQGMSNVRRANYCILEEALENTDGIEICFPHLKSNTVPLYFPVFIDKAKRNFLRNSMREQDILLPVIWPVSSFLNNRISMTVAKIYDEILAVPCDQRYTAEEMYFVGDKIKQKIRERRYDEII